MPRYWGLTEDSSYQQVAHLVSRSNERSQNGTSPGKPYSTFELALIDWVEKRAELDAGEIIREEYEDWKDSYSPGKKAELA